MLHKTNVVMYSKSTTMQYARYTQVYFEKLHLFVIKVNIILNGFTIKRMSIMPIIPFRSQ